MIMRDIMVSEKASSNVLSGVEQDGFVLPKKTRFENEFISECKLKNAKLCDPIFDQCVLENCTFEKADFSGSRFFNKTSLTHCSFKNVDFQSSGFSNSKFENCTFARCNFREASLKNCTFINCIFLHCRIIDNSFNASTTFNVKFTGKLQEVNFISDTPNTPLSADFEFCKLDYVTFENCDLENITPPTEAKHIFFKDVAARAKRALTVISAEPESQLNKILKRRLLKLTTQRGAVLNTENLETYEGKEFTARFISLLRDA